MPLNITIPDFPKTWLAHSDVVLRTGQKPQCVIIQPWNSVTPYVVHTAYAEGGQWEYEQGDYCYNLEDAQKAFSKRT